MHARKPFHITLAALAAAAGLALSACSSGAAEDDAAPTMTTVIEAATATDNPAPAAGGSGEAQPGGDNAGGEAGGSGGSSDGDGAGNGGAEGNGIGSSGNAGNDGENCGVDSAAAAITDNIWQVPAPSLDGMTWIYKGDSNFDPCATLSYATVEQSEQGNAQYQNQLMLFHNGEYLGVGSDTVQQHRIVATTDDSVTVAYKDYEALDAANAPNAESPNYTTNVTFRWDGSKVVPEGRFPNLSRQ